MTGALTAQIQGDARPELDAAYAELGQRVKVYRVQGGTTAQDGPPPPDLDLDGNPVMPGTPDPTPEQPGMGEALGDYPCIAYQLDAQDRAAAGVALGTPTWEIVVHWSAPLDTPGLLLQVSGGELPAPLLLVPVADIEDMGTQRVAWTCVCQAPDALRGN